MPKTKALCQNCKKQPVSSARAKYCSEACKQKAKRSKIVLESTPAGPNNFAAIAEQRMALDEAKVPVEGRSFIDEDGVIHGPVPETDTYRLAADPFKITATKRHSPFDTRDPEYDEAAALKKFEAMGLPEPEWVTTGIPEFDALTKIPKGRITQIHGPWGVGKTTLCLNMVKGLSQQKVLYIDTESSLNPVLLAGMGINPDNFRLYNDSAFVEDVYDTLMRALKKPQFDLIVLDSLAAMTNQVEAAGKLADANMGHTAKMLNKLFRIIPMELKRTNTALVVINQERKSFDPYGPPTYVLGGDGLKYGLSLAVRLSTTKAQRFPKSGPPFKGHEVTAEIVKSKVNVPGRKATFPIFYLPGQAQ